MHRHFFQGAKDAIKQWKSSLVFVLAMVVFIQLMLMCLLALEIQGHSLQVANKLITQDVTLLRPYYQDSAPIKSPELLPLLSEHLTLSKDAYSLIEAGEVDQNPVYIALGAYGRVFGMISQEVAQQTEDALLLIGSKVVTHKPGDSVVILDKSYTVASRLPENTTGLLYRLGISFDEAVVLLCTFDEFTKYHYYPTMMDEVLSRMAFIGAKPEEIESYLTVANQSGGVFVVPEKLNERLLPEYQESMNAYRLLGSITLVLLVLVLFGTLVSLLLMMDQMLRTFAIHRLYGCGILALYLRTFGYILPILLIPSVLALYRIPYTTVKTRMLLAICMLVFTLALSMTPVIFLKRRNDTDYLRRDVS